jgi:anti-anti-sigma regulatory factor
VPIDMAGVERIDFVCAGALLNAINRVEAQRKAVQILGVSPIVRRCCSSSESRRAIS